MASSSHYLVNNNSSSSSSNFRRSSSEILTTLGSFTTEQLYYKLVQTANLVVNDIVSASLDQEVVIANYVQEGVNPFLDNLIAAQGQVAKYYAEDLVEGWLNWRKSYQVELPTEVAEKRRTDHHSKIPAKDMISLLTERRLLAADFIFCRVMIQVARNAKEVSTGLFRQLEDLSFEQVKHGDVDQMSKSKNKQRQQDLFAELIGALSQLRFLDVVDRFESEMKQLRENKMELLIRGMRFVNLKIYPMTCLEESADFLQMCGNFFETTHNLKIKHALAEMLSDLLAPIAAVADAEVNVPSWAKSIDPIYKKAMKMSTKPKHASVAYPLVTNLLCVSRKEVFLSNWVPFMERCCSLFKEKSQREECLGCVAQLLWVYLFRFRDEEANTMSTIQSITKGIFPEGKRFIMPQLDVDGDLDNFVNIVHFVGMRKRDFAIKKVILSLLNADGSAAISPDTVFPERAVIAIRAIYAIIDDLEKNEKRPLFPFPSDLLPSGGSKRHRRNDISQFMSDDAIQSLGLTMYMEQINTALGQILLAIHQTISLGSQRNEKVAGKLFTDIIPKEKLGFIEVAKVVLMGIPRFHPAMNRTTDNSVKLFNVLISFTEHLDHTLVAEAASSLLRLMEQCPQYRIQLIILFANNINTISDKYTTVLLRQLELFVDMLTVWIAESGKTGLTKNSSLQRHYSLFNTKSSRSSIETLPRGPVKVESHVIEIVEKLGILFLANGDASVRKAALDILKLAGYFRTADTPDMEKMGSDSANLKNIASRVIDVIEDSFPDVLAKLASGSEGLSMDGSDEINVPADRPYADLIRSSAPFDQMLWMRCYAELLLTLFETHPVSVSSVWPIVCNRLLEVMPVIVAYASPPQYSTLSLVGTFGRSNAPSIPTVTEAQINQWRSYLFFACSTASIPESEQDSEAGSTGTSGALVAAGSSGTSGSLSKKKEKPITTISSARDLFRLVLPFLKSDKEMIAASVVAALGLTNWRVLRVLLDEMQPIVKTIFVEDVKQKKSKTLDSLRVEIGHVYHLTANLLNRKSFATDDAMMKIVMDYILLTKSFLVQNSQLQPELIMIRYHFCGFVADVYSNVCRLEAVCARYFPSSLRAALFYLFEDWAGITAKITGNVRHEASSATVSTPGKDNKRKEAISKEAVSNRMTKLQNQAMEAMAILCKGTLVGKVKRPALTMASPSSSSGAGGAGGEDEYVFNMDGLFKWIDLLFESDDPQFHNIASLALESLLQFNPKETTLLDSVVDASYGSMTTKSKQSFKSLVQSYTLQPIEFRLPTLLNLILFKTADPDQQVRKLAVQLLLIVEERNLLRSVSADYRISLTSSLPTTYKQSQAILSARLAVEHKEFTYDLFSEMSRRMKTVSRARQRDMLSFILPWVANFELTLDGEGGVSDESQSILCFLLLITVKYGEDYAQEVESLWLQLTKEKTGNIPILIKFLIEVGLGLGHPNFLAHAKKIVVSVGRTKGCKKLVDCLLAEITPERFGVQPKKAASRPAATLRSQKSSMVLLEAAAASVRRPVETVEFAELSESLGGAVKGEVSMSAGELALMLLVDLTIEVSEELRPHLAHLLHIVFLNMDHKALTIYDQSRLLFINLIHSLVARHSIARQVLQKATSLILFLTSKEGAPLWESEERSVDRTVELPSEKELESLVSQVLEVFSLETDLKQRWIQVSLNWATTCSNRHLANRSIQVFRALSPPLSHQTLSDIITKLSASICSTRDLVQIYALELSLTLEMFIDSSEQKILLYPQLFWTSVALLQSNERNEYLHGIHLLQKLFRKLDFEDEHVFNVTMAQLPSRWSPPFDGILPLLLKGLSCDMTESATLDLLGTICGIGRDDIIHKSPSRLLFTVLGTLPYLLLNVEMSNAKSGARAIQLANHVADAAEKFNSPEIVKHMRLYSRRKVKHGEQWSQQVVSFLQNTYFPLYEFEALKFLLTLLDYGPLAYKAPVLLILRAMIGRLELSESHAGIHADIIGPIFRLLNTPSTEEALLMINHTVSISTGPSSSRPDNKKDTMKLKNALASRYSPNVVESLWEDAHPWWNRLEEAQGTVRTNLSRIRGMCSSEVRENRPPGITLRIPPDISNFFSPQTSPKLSDGPHSSVSSGLPSPTRELLLQEEEEVQAAPMPTIRTDETEQEEAAEEEPQTPRHAAMKQGVRLGIRRSMSAPPAVNSVYSAALLALLTKPSTRVVINVFFKGDYSFIASYKPEELDRMFKEDLRKHTMINTSRFQMLKVQGDPVVLTFEIMSRAVSFSRGTKRDDPIKTAADNLLLVDDIRFLTKNPKCPLFDDKEMRFPLDPAKDISVLIVTPTDRMPIRMENLAELEAYLSSSKSASLWVAAADGENGDREPHLEEAKWTSFMDTWEEYWNCESSREIQLESAATIDDALLLVEAFRVFPMAMALVNTVCKEFLQFLRAFPKVLPPRCVDGSLSDTAAHLIGLIEQLPSDLLSTPISLHSVDQLTTMALKFIHLQEIDRDYGKTFLEQRTDLFNALHLQLGTYLYERLISYDFVPLSHPTWKQGEKNWWFEVQLCNQFFHLVRLLQFVVSLEYLIEEMRGSSKSSIMQLYQSTEELLQRHSNFVEAQFQPPTHNTSEASAIIAATTNGHGD